MIQKLVTRAIELGGEELEFEWKDGYDEVFVFKGPLGFGIARVRSNTPKDVSLRHELHAMTRKTRRLAIGGCEYALRAHAYESFGEMAYRLAWRRLARSTPGGGRKKRS